MEFSHPLCAECMEWERRLSTERAPAVTIDVRERPDLARKYGIAIVPTVVQVSANGRVHGLVRRLRAASSASAASAIPSTGNIGFQGIQGSRCCLHARKRKSSVRSHGEARAGAG